MNLLEETLAAVKDPKRVSWVGNADGSLAMSFEDFARIAADVDYDDDYGSQEIAADLIVVLNDGTWLSRYEYDGSECWTLNSPPILKIDAKPFQVVKDTRTVGSRLADMQPTS